ncbi:NAD(P)H-hydrate dehydratase [Aquisalinus flavus]|nr:NAD(P)H-hydrate dehydratase [Aquisalinus flavus]UNE49244.1 NAD(P)H-hydrate dehydratase [Aquisalinus flavus]
MKHRPIELLTTDEMARADALTTQSGTAGATLMEAAGAAVAGCVRQAWLPRPVLVLCGPGNNGGDGFVVARLLKDAGWPVTLALLGEKDKLTGDAALMADHWHGGIEPLSDAEPEKAAVIVDALFGAGLSRSIEGDVAALVERVNKAEAPVIAIDVPSGIDGTTGQALGTAIRAKTTVTFFRLKPGHMLYPGTDHCGEVILADIGIHASVLEAIKPSAFVNGPELWRADFPWPADNSHKYSRGHAVVMSGGRYTGGAARLAAMGAARAGAGAVTMLSPQEAMDINAGHLEEVMLTEAADGETISQFIAERKVKAGLIGPGAGRGAQTRDRVAALLFSEAGAVLDADALTSFEDNPETLFQALREKDVITPHAGEFARLFGDLLDGQSKLAAARIAADMAGCVVILKGSDTVVAAPDGRAAINANATPFLATAGSGDVLAGIVTGLMAQGMAGFEAACAGVWLHAEAAAGFGPGLIASDIHRHLPRVLATLKAP